MATINNLMLYIKRAETNHTKELIIEAFASNNIGKVRDVRFIKKMAENGKEYNGVVVIFDSWNMNSYVKQLLDQMSSSPDGTTKFTYDSYNRRYWIINVYKTQFPEYEEITTVDSSLPDKEKIKELENLVKSMAVQMHYMQQIQEKTERQLMESECSDTQTRLYNMELHSQLEEKKYIQLNLEEENDVLRDRIKWFSVMLKKKEDECDELGDELYNNRCILDFVQTQANEMREMVRFANEPHYNNKQDLIEELLD